MTKFAQTAIKAQTLETIYNSIKERMEWHISRNPDTHEAWDEEEAMKEKVFNDVLAAIEKML